MAQATQQELNKFVEVVDKFMANYAKLTAPGVREQVIATGDSEFIDDYDIAVGRGRILKRTIETTVGAWNTAKREYARITDTTSTAIGDAIDEIRSWFGYEPAGDLSCYDKSGLGSLGALQIPAAAWVTGIIVAAVALNKSISNIFVRLEANRLQRENPNLPREVAIAQATARLPRLFPDTPNIALIAVAAIGAWFIFGRGR